MDFEEIRDRIRGPGFRPFRLHLSDGRAFDVPHPEFVAASSRVVAVLSETGPSELIDLAHIVYRLQSSQSLQVYSHPVFLGAVTLTFVLERWRPARPGQPVFSVGLAHYECVVFA